MKELINEELNYMKYLFGYQRGKVVSEQSTITTTTTTTQTPTTSNFTPPEQEVSGNLPCDKGYYKDCTTKLCTPIPKDTWISFNKRSTDYYKDAIVLAKKRNVESEKYIKKWGLEKYDWLNSVFTDLYGNSKAYNEITDRNLLLLKKQYWHNGDGLGTVTYKIMNIIIGCWTNIIKTPVTTEPIPTVKIENINQITKVEDFPKDFVLSGDYRCSGTNSLGYKSQPSTFEQQCMDLPSSMKTFDKLSAWEIKFPPNVAGNPKTVPVTRWDFIWDSQGKIKEIKMQNFNKIGKEEQVVYDNLLSQKSSDENLKAFMKIAYGSDDNYNERVGNLLI
jgi:hypothetical protein